MFSASRGGAWDLLTEAERSVAEAVVRGARTAEIAAARGTKPSTVARQLHYIYAKLGVSGRVALVERLLDGSSKE